MLGIAHYTSCTIYEAITCRYKPNTLLYSNRSTVTVVMVTNDCMSMPSIFVVASRPTVKLDN